jgi:hypothetical protein
LAPLQEVRSIVSYFTGCGLTDRHLASVGIMSATNPFKFAIAGSFGLTYMQIAYCSINYGLSKFNIDNVYSHALSGSIVGASVVSFHLTVALWKIISNNS